MAMPAGDEVGFPPDLIEASDADLIGRAAQGEARALEVLYERYSGVVFSFALRIVADRPLAEEILQEAFFRAWQQGSNFSAGRGTFITWLLSITHNLSIDEIRRRRRRPQKAESEEPEQVLASVPDTGSGADVEDEVWLGALRETIGEALAELAAGTAGSDRDGVLPGNDSARDSRSVGRAPGNDQDENAPGTAKAPGRARE